MGCKGTNPNSPLSLPEESPGRGEAFAVWRRQQNICVTIQVDRLKENPGHSAEADLDFPSDFSLQPKQLNSYKFAGN
jgi:hypothetical protein